MNGYNDWLRYGGMDNYHYFELSDYLARVKQSGQDTVEISPTDETYFTLEIVYDENRASMLSATDQDGTQVTEEQIEQTLKQNGCKNLDWNLRQAAERYNLLIEKYEREKDMRLYDAHLSSQFDSRNDR